jgi:DNA-binding PadR family transcriptional regulator
MGISVLDLYVLSMLDRGVTTPYDLQHHAGLSQGAAIPALRRLSTARLIHKTEEESPTKRPRHRYALTGNGRRVVRSQALRLLTNAEYSSNLDSMLRVADIALYYGVPRLRVVKALESAADERDAIASEPSMPHDDDNAVGLYIAFRRMFDRARLTAEAQTLRRMARRVGRSAHRKPVSNSSAAARKHR